MIFPFVSNTVYEMTESSRAQAFEKQYSDMDVGLKEKLIEEADQYNESALKASVTLTDPFTIANDQSSFNYVQILDVDGSGIIGYLEIPVIDVKLPIYHGCSEEVLKRGLGHLEGTSFPIGRTGTHSVITGHTGLSSARLFTDLVNVKEEDYFYIYLFDDIYAYQVREINVVLPEDMSLLRISKDQDKVTLLTCTPYGINSHRLLVTGYRVDYEKEIYEEQSDNALESQWMISYKKAVLIGIGIVIFLYSIRLILCSVRKRYA